jgi:hypothetical protein
MKKYTPFLIAKQTGQHRLGTVALTDGRFFLSADVLLQSELFGDRMVGIEYEEATLDDVQALLLRRRRTLSMNTIYSGNLTESCMHGNLI